MTLLISRPLQCTLSPSKLAMRYIDFAPEKGKYLHERVLVWDKYFALIYFDLHEFVDLVFSLHVFGQLQL